MVTNDAWQEARSAFTQADGSINIAGVALDRQLAAGRGAHIAIQLLRKDGSTERVSYQDLYQRAATFANALLAYGIGNEGRVFSLLGRVPELYVCALGTLRCGAVFTPLFAAFGPEPIRTRLEIGHGNVLITTSALYKRKVAGMRAELPHLRLVIVVDGAAGKPPGGTVHYDTFMSKGVSVDPPESLPAATRPDDLALVHFTSGTTGRPKGVMHVHEAVIAHHVSASLALDMQPSDVYWCTADPGWVTGTSYGIIAPLTHGVTMVVDEAEFDPRRWYQILEEQQVNVWYTAPTAIRMLMKAGTELAHAHKFPALRFMASVGEPLNPQAVVWGEEAFGQPFHDNWWQTETGSIMIANLPGEPVKPGAMGKPLPGIETAVVDHNGKFDIVEAADATGELALCKGWPSMMRGYVDEMARFEKCFVGDWYLTGDLVRRDAEGYYWFVSRADDVIQSAGHLISPFEVESALLAHAAVAEAAVVGLPDDTVGEVVSAYVSLANGQDWSEAVQKDINRSWKSWFWSRVGTSLTAPEGSLTILQIPVGI